MARKYLFGAKTPEQHLKKCLEFKERWSNRGQVEYTPEQVEEGVRRIEEKRKREEEVLKTAVENYIEYPTKASQRYRNKVFNHYGKWCRCCGIKDSRFLTIDHVYNDGAEHRRKEKISCLAKWIVDNHYPSERFQILCWNCNLGKYHNKGICPHKAKEIVQDR